MQARGQPESRQAAFSLSPGDLDEVVQSFLVFGDPVEAKQAARGTSFERVEAFRLGFFQDEQACLAITGELIGGLTRRGDRAGGGTRPRFPRWHRAR